MILDKDGKEIPAPSAPKPHRFGEFVIPTNAHIKGFGSIDGKEHRTDMWDEMCRENAQTMDQLCQ